MEDVGSAAYSALPGDGAKLRAKKYARAAHAIRSANCRMLRWRKGLDDCTFEEAAPLANISEPASHK